MRKIYNYILIACLCFLVIACKNDKPSGGQAKSYWDCYEVYNNFVIKKIQMSRVTIEGIPARNHTLFILKMCIEGTNPKRIVRRKGLEGGWVQPYRYGCADSVYRIEFKTKANKMVSPNPLKWDKDKNEYGLLTIAQKNSEHTKLVLYEDDYEYLPSEIERPVELKIRFHVLKDTLYYLIAFQKKSELPDSVILVMSGTDIKAPIDDSTISEYYLKKRSQWGEHTDRPNDVRDVTEKMPSFPGGMGALVQYLKNSIDYPIEALKENIGGRVVVAFIVEKDGSLSDVRIANSVHPLLDAEAIRVVSSMPKWNPGLENGNPVRVKYTIPVTFRLEEKKN